MSQKNVSPLYIVIYKEGKRFSGTPGMTLFFRDLRGALASDVEMRDFLEKNIQQHEIVLTDLESRQVTTLRSEET